MSKKDQRHFEDVLQALQDANIDVDRFLKAARLERHDRITMREIWGSINWASVAGFLLAALGMVLLFCVISKWIDLEQAALLARHR